MVLRPLELFKKSFRMESAPKMRSDVWQTTYGTENIKKVISHHLVFVPHGTKQTDPPRTMATD